MSWITKSNRLYHLFAGIIAAVFGTLIGAAEVACTSELKDCQSDPENRGKKPWNWTFRRWDWLDWTATIIGGIIGQIVQAILLYLIFKNPY